MDFALLSDDDFVSPFALLSEVVLLSVFALLSVVLPVVTDWLLFSDIFAALPEISPAVSESFFADFIKHLKTFGTDANIHFLVFDV